LFSSLGGDVTPHDGHLEHELEDVVGGLNMYVADMQQTVDRQSHELARLGAEKSKMVQKLRELEEERELTRNQSGEISYMRQVCGFI